jgi:hypothetical protein
MIETTWEEIAIAHLHKQFIEEFTIGSEKPSYFAYFTSGEYQVVLDAEKLNYYTALILTEGYGERT